CRAAPALHARRTPAPWAITIAVKREHMQRKGWWRPRSTQAAPEAPQHAGQGIQTLGMRILHVMLDVPWPPAMLHHTRASELPRTPLTRRCAYCGGLAMLGTQVCYTCASR